MKMKVADLKRGERLWCWWMHRYLYFRRSYFSHLRGVTIYEFEDVGDAKVDLLESQVGKLERRA